MLDKMLTLQGMQVVIIPVTKIRRKLKWRERIFSWPWRPNITHVIEMSSPLLGEGQVVRYENILYMRQETFNQLKEETENV